MKTDSKNSAGHSKPIPDNLDSGIALQSKIWKLMRRWKSQFIVSGVVVIFAILSFLDEVLDLPHLLAGAPPTPINWAEIVLDLVALFLVGSISIFMLSIVELRRKRAEEALREMEERLRTFVESATDGFFLLDSELNYVEINKTGLGLFPAGTKKEDIIGKNIVEIVPDIKETGRYDKYMNVIKTGKPFFIDDIVPHPRFGDVHLALRAFEVENSLGIITTDITERKRAEEALQISEQKFKDLTETTTDWVWEVDKNGVYTYVSPKVKELLGYEVSEVLGKTPFDLMPKEEAERIGKFFNEKVLNKEPFYILENENRHKDGHLLVLETSGIPIFDERGQLEGYRGIDRDISERKKAEEALRLQSEIAANMSEGVYLIRASDGVIVYTNPKFEEIFGYGPDEMLGKHVSIVNAPTEKSPEETAKEISEFINKHGFWRGEINNIKKDGTPFWCYASVSMFDHPEHGRVWVVVHTDVTERRRAEEAVRKKDEELEAFVYMVSHDLKNPVVSIQGFCSSILKSQREELNEKTLFYIQRVQANASLMTSLLEDLLELSRIGRIEDKKTAISVQQVIKSVWTGVSRSLPTKDVEFILPENLPQVLYSEKRLYQVFSNLLSNAVKFKSENRILQVEIGYKDNRDNYTFYVRDNGIGIEQKYHNKIFEVFSQLKDTKSEGTGMGLGIVKKIVEANQGKVWVKSQKGEGSTFYFTIPKKA